MNAPLDMRDTIIPKSDQLNADDLIGGPLAVRITKVSRANTTEQPIAVSFDGDGGKPYMPCKSMRRVMVTVWGPDASAYVGRSMTLYRDPEVTWGGMAVGGIRISHMSHITEPVVMALTATKKNKKPFRVQPLVIDDPKPATDPAAAVAARIIELADAIETPERMAAFDAHAGTTSRRDRLRAERPELSRDVEAAIMGARMRVKPPAATAPADDGWPGPDVAADGEGV